MATHALSGVMFTAIMMGLSAGVVVAAEDKSVTAIGQAAGTDLKAKDEALQDAKRKAVQQACGELINAQSQVQDFEVKRDRILATAAGYLTSYRVVRQWVEGGISNCEVFATVSVGQFEADWKAMFAHIREDMGNPRCVVVISEDPDIDDDNPARFNGVAQSKIENYLLSHDVQLMDKGVSEDVKRRDETVATLADDVQRLAARAAEFKADILVLGRAEARRGGSTPVGSHAVFSWDVSLNVRVVQADSAQVIFSQTYRPQKPYTTTLAIGSGEAGIAALAEEKAPQLLRDVAQAWKNRLTSHRVFQVTIDGCNRADFRQKVRPALLAVRGVDQGDEGVKLRELINDAAVVEVYWSFDLDALADSLESLPLDGLKLTVVEQSGTRLRAKLETAPAGTAP